jgi:excisionase family DNA binding protein
MSYTKAEPVAPAYLRPSEAARYCSVSGWTLQRWAKEGRLRVLRPSAGVVLYAVADLDRLIRGDGQG